jgi:hypothetical protein
MFVELGLGGRKCSVEIIFVKGGVDDFVAVILEVGRLDAARNAVSSVQEEDFHIARLLFKRDRIHL